MGIVMLVGAYRIFDLLTPTNMNDAIFRDNKISVAIAVGAYMLGVALIVAAALS